MNLMKKILPDVIAVLVFIIISFAYFTPSAFEGRILFRHDASEGVGAGQEAKEYYEKTGERTRWTNSIFGGMPTYQMSPSYKTTDVLKKIENIYHLYLPTYVWYVFVMLLGFYILLRAFDFRVWMGALGAIIWAFSSYFFIIIAAGHIWKFITLAYIPPTIAGMVLIYRGKYLWGGFMTALFVALQIMSNHVQMSYYFLFVMLFMFIAFAVQAYLQKEWVCFGKATCVLILSALIGVCANISNLYHTYEYSKESMRSKSELVKENNSNQTKSGLERDYITQWSYGIGETFSLLVPNVKGGASVPLSANEKAMQKADPMYVNLYGQLGQYWGEQPGTSGPVYVGAFVVFLFILALLIVKTPMKWALLAATILSFFLSWGKNFMGFTDFFLDYIPMYDKFRAVSSILVIAEFTIPLLAMLGLRELLKSPSMVKEYRKELLISLGLTAGIALLFALFPDFFFSSFISTSEMDALQKAIPSEQLTPLLINLTAVRESIFTSDSWRSVIFILVGVCIIWLYGYQKIQARMAVLLLAILCLVDMWNVNKRYLNDEMFVPQTAQKESFQLSETDKQILADQALDYRVLNLSTNTFNENFTSYWHKSIGGYHAAKLRRYQEMIEEHISPEINQVYKEISNAGGDMSAVDASKFPVLNMLNTRYFILPLQGGNTIPLQNPYCFGNAWFVDRVSYVKNANDEIDAFYDVNPKEVAIVSESFKNVISDKISQDSLRSIQLVSYEPNKLVYSTQSSQDGVVVFSEIYYPGWNVTIDGEKAVCGRADYILRAMNVPSGKHEIVFDFHPKTLKVTETIASISLVLLLMLLIAVVYVNGKQFLGKEKKS